MKREARILLEKAVGSLILGIEIFNRPSDIGRTEAVLIFLDHSFEMLLKASIVERGGRIFTPPDPHTIGFELCVKTCISDGKVRFLTDADAVVIRSLNLLRDAAQHYLVSLSEQQLYIHAQSALTLFRNIMRDVLKQDLALELPERVLPLSTTPPVDLEAMFDIEIEEVKKLLGPGRRQQVEAMARLRGIAVVHAAIEGKTTLPTNSELQKLSKKVLDGEKPNQLFPGLATVNLTSTGDGPSFDLRITKNEGMAVYLVGEDVAGATLIGVKRVDELGYYTLGRDAVAEKVNLNTSQTSAMIWHLKLKGDLTYYKEFKIGATRHKLYSQKSVAKILEALKNVKIAEISTAYQKSLPKKSNKAKAAGKK